MIVSVPESEGSQLGEYSHEGHPYGGSSLDPSSEMMQGLGELEAEEVVQSMDEWEKRLRATRLQEGLAESWLTRFELSMSQECPGHWRSCVVGRFRRTLPGMRSRIPASSTSES